MADLRDHIEDPESALEARGDVPVLEAVYGSIARISALATGKELAAHP